MNTTRKLGLLAALAMLGSLSVAPLSAQTTVETVATNFFEPYGVATDADGAIYVTEGSNHRVVKLLSGTTVGTVFAGQTFTAGTNDGVANAAQFNQPQGIIFARGGLVVADSANHTLRFIALNGVVTTLAGAPGVFGNINGSATDARFRFPTGLATDSDGNIYIADSQNNAIRKLDTNNTVSTVWSSTLFQPSGIAIGVNGDLWIADTRHHCIKRLDTNGVITVVAGVSGTAGSSDSIAATNALFTNPRALLWLSPGSGLLVSDSGSHTIRRIFYNTNFATYSVETYAGKAGVSGLTNGPAVTAATFNTPITICRDLISGGFLIADKANNALRRINTGAVQPPVSDPVIGWVDLVKDAFGAYVTLLRPVIVATFNNDVVIAIKSELGTATYYTFGPTPPSQFEDTIPAPGPGSGLTPPLYRDGALASEMPQTLTTPQPDLTIKAIGVQDGRRSSAMVQSRFLFKTANPIIIGENAASFTVDNITTGASIWYTIDGSEPTNNPAANPNVVGPRAAGDTISFNLFGTNITFKVKAFKNNYKPSETITKVFTTMNFVANKLSLGFASGEASSEFVASAGQRFYAPVTLTVLPSQKIYSFQFNAVVTNIAGPAVDGSLPAFKSMLMKPFPDDPILFVPIPPQAFVGFDGNTNSVMTNMVVTNASINLLGVGWLERATQTNLYDTVAQDLITYSQAHDNRFLSANGKVIMGAYSFVVPPLAADGSTYQIKLGRSSATSDGVNKDVYIEIPTNGSSTVGPINGTKTVTVGIRRYVVGDVAPFRWLNAGDFGDTNILNNDVLQVFQSASYGFNTPPAGSDMLDALDSSDGTSNGLLDGSDTAIDSIFFGDGALNVDDIFVTFRRSIDPSRKWFARYWQNGVRQFVEVPNVAPGTTPPPPPVPPAASLPLRTDIPTVALLADDVIGTAGSSVNVPVRVHIQGGLPIRVAMFSVTVQPLDGSPALTSPLDIIPAAALGAPGIRNSVTSNEISVAWLNNTVSGISGDATLATLVIPIPLGAPANAAYRIHFNHFSASPNGLGLLRKSVYDGIVSVSNRGGSSAGDGISDVWRLRWFGSVNDARSGADVDADKDGRTNLQEYQAGTNPVDLRSFLGLGTAPLFNGVKLSFPTGAGRSYILEWAGQLNGPWNPFSTNIGDGNLREVNDTPLSNRFYRIRAQ